MAQNTKSSSYTFLPWFRRGAVTAIEEPDYSYFTGSHATVNARVSVNKQGSTLEVEALSRNISLIGPGEISAISDEQIIRTYPVHGTNNVPNTYLPFIEFYDEDFLWRYTPAAPIDIKQYSKLRPWLMILCLKKGEFELTSGQEQSILTVLAEKAVYPLNTQSWAYAHTQIIGDIDNIEDELEQDPNSGLCRLLSPRRLNGSEQCDFTCFLVPAFKRGVAILDSELGLTRENAPNAQESSWTDDNVDSDQLGLTSSKNAHSFPVYHQWSFSTNTDGDFETLVKKLADAKKVMPEGIGQRQVSIAKKGISLDLYTDNTDNDSLAFALGGALKPIGATIDAFNNLEYKEQLIKVLNAEYNINNQNHSSDDPMVLPPIYGKHNAQINKIIAQKNTQNSKLNTPPWLNELNLEPANRSAAGLGTVTVQEHQEQLMNSAWQQVGEIDSANQRLRESRFCGAILDSLFYKRISNQAPDNLGSFLSPTFKHSVSKQKKLSIEAELEQSSTANALFDRTFSKLCRTKDFNKLSRANSLSKGQITPNVYGNRTPPKSSVSIAKMLAAYNEKLIQAADDPFYVMMHCFAQVFKNSYIKGAGLTGVLPKSTELQQYIPYTSKFNYQSLMSLFQGDINIVASNEIPQSFMTDLDYSSLGLIAQNDGNFIITMLHDETGPLKQKATSLIYQHYKNTNVIDFSDFKTTKINIPLKPPSAVCNNCHWSRYESDNGNSCKIDNCRLSLSTESLDSIILPELKKVLRDSIPENFELISADGNQKPYNINSETKQTAQGLFGYVKAIEWKKIHGHPRLVIIVHDNGFYFKFRQLRYAYKTQNNLILIPLRLYNKGPERAYKDLRPMLSIEELQRYQPQLKALLTANSEADKSIASFDTFSISNLRVENSLYANSLSAINTGINTGSLAFDKKLLAHPEFDIPVVDYLSQISTDFLLPGINKLEDDSVFVFETNSDFIESYMLGLNHEMARELLWREFPTDMQGTYFNQFWDRKDAPNSSSKNDIKPLHTWSTPVLGYKEQKQQQKLRAIKIRHLNKKYQFTEAKLLGQEFRHWHIVLSEFRGHKRSEIEQPNAGHTPNEKLLKSNKARLTYSINKDLSLGNNGYQNDANLVLLCKTELFEKYPNTIVFMQKSGEDKQLELVDEPELRNPPSFSGQLTGGISWFGFDLLKEALTGTGWHFIFQERPGELTFGYDNETDVLRSTHMSNSAQVARELIQKPIIYAMHSSDLLGS